MCAVVLNKGQIIIYGEVGMEKYAENENSARASFSKPDVHNVFLYCTLGV